MRRCLSTPPAASQHALRFSRWRDMSLQAWQELLPTMSACTRSRCERWWRLSSFNNGNKAEEKPRPTPSQQVAIGKSRSIRIQGRKEEDQVTETKLSSQPSHRNVFLPFLQTNFVQEHLPLRFASTAMTPLPLITIRKGQLNPDKSRSRELEALPWLTERVRQDEKDLRLLRKSLKGRG